MDAVKRQQFINILSQQHGNSLQTVECIRELSNAVERIGTRYKFGEVALAVQMISDELLTRLNLNQKTVKEI